MRKIGIAASAGVSRRVRAQSGCGSAVNSVSDQPIVTSPSERELNQSPARCFASASVAGCAGSGNSRADGVEIVQQTFRVGALNRQIGADLAPTGFDQFGQIIGPDLVRQRRPGESAAGRGAPGGTPRARHRPANGW